MFKTMLTAVVACCSLLVAACSDDQPVADTEPPASSSAPSSSTGGPSPSEGSPTSESPEPTGERVGVDGVSLTVPAGWKVSDKSGSSFMLRNKSTGTELVSVISILNAGNGNLVKARGLAADTRMQKPQVQENTEVAGEEAWHLTGAFGRTGLVTAYGVVSKGYDVSFTFIFPRRGGGAERAEEFADEVLATVELE